MLLNLSFSFIWRKALGGVLNKNFLSNCVVLMLLQEKAWLPAHGVSLGGCQLKTPCREKGSQTLWQHQNGSRSASAAGPTRALFERPWDHQHSNKIGRRRGTSVHHDKPHRTAMWLKNASPLSAERRDVTPTLLWWSCWKQATSMEGTLPEKGESKKRVPGENRSKKKKKCSNLCWINCQLETHSILHNAWKSEQTRNKPWIWYQTKTIQSDLCWADTRRKERREPLESSVSVKNESFQNLCVSAHT